MIWDGKLKLYCWECLDRTPQLFRQDVHNGSHWVCTQCAFTNFVKGMKAIELRSKTSL